MKTPRVLSFVLLAVALLLAVNAHAKIQTKVVSYEYGGAALKGYLAWDDAVAGERPGILVVHDFWGLNDYAKRRTEQLAGLGYVAFAADMYGDGRVGKHPEDARAMMAEVRKNQDVWMGRANAALATLRGQANVAPGKLAAIGYCFGGGTVLLMAYGGADLKAVVSFHGGLTVPASTSAIKGRLLVLHGADDPHVSAETVAGLKAALDKGKVNYKFIAYPGAVHSFTVKEAGNDPSKGSAYNAEADRKSWEEMVRLFQELWSGRANSGS